MFCDEKLLNIFLYLCIYFVQKTVYLILKKPSGMVGRRKLPDPSLNGICNALSIGVQYMLSCHWTNFGLKCLLSWHWTVMQNGIHSDLLVSKMACGIGWTFIRALQSLKDCILMGSFCQKHLMFQLENFRGIMCHDTEGWCRI